MSELCNLKLSDINLKENKFIVNGKGNKERYCYLNDSTKKTLQEYIKLRENQIGSKDNKKENDWLFISRQSAKISIRQVNRLVKKAYSDAGLDERQYGVHTLRHSFATILYKSGVDIRLLQVVQLKLQNGQVEIILRALELYKYNLNYMLDTEHCSDNERQEKLAMIKYTFEQVLSIQAEQVNGKSEDVETSSAFKKVLPESNMLDDIIPINKNLKIC